MRLNDRTTSTALAEKYDAIPYEAKSNALSHPDHMAVVATLFGLAPPNVVTCRVLEFGCNDGANLLPMAASLPDAQFVGCDLSPRAIAGARQIAAALAAPGTTQNKTDALLRAEFERVAQVTDSALYHDDLAEPNDPVYFREFVAHAGAHGLEFASEAQLRVTRPVDVAPS